KVRCRLALLPFLISCLIWLDLVASLPLIKELEGTLQAGTSAVSDKLLDLVGLGGKSAADKGKDTRDYLAAAFPELNAWERSEERRVGKECRSRGALYDDTTKHGQQGAECVEGLYGARRAEHQR